MDKYVSLEDFKDSTGNTMVAKSDQLTEDAVSKLVTAGVRRNYSTPKLEFGPVRCYADL